MNRNPKMISAFLSVLLLCSSLTACAPGNGMLPGDGTASAFSTNSESEPSTSTGTFSSNNEPEPPTPTGTFAVTLIDSEHYVTGILQSAGNDSHSITELYPVIPGTVLTFYTDVHEGAEPWMYVNGRFHGYPQPTAQNGQPAWKFTFCMSAEPATIEFRVQNLYTTVRNLIPATTELTAETVVQITCETGYYGVSPDFLPKITSSSSHGDIANALEVLDTQMIPVSIEQTLIGGGCYTQYTYHTAGGETFVLRISNGNIRVGDQYYRYCGTTLPIPPEGESTDTEKTA